MNTSLSKMLQGYREFREKYASGDNSIMNSLADQGQKPQIMVIACCDSRVDPALILQCDPGDLFVVRNVANIVPPYEKDEAYHGTSAALEFGICFLKVQDLVLLGHSQCGGIQTLMNDHDQNQNDFISNWVSIMQNPAAKASSEDDCAKLALNQSYGNCMTFPWLKEKVLNHQLNIHLWFFDVKSGKIFSRERSDMDYEPLE